MPGVSGEHVVTPLFDRRVSMSTVTAQANFSFGCDLAPTAWVRMPTLKASSVLDEYWRFAAERQRVFYARLAGLPGPWTSDPILRQYRFTNVYRATDRVSQFLIKNVIYEGDRTAEETFFRTILFKLFNKIDTWVLLEKVFGSIEFGSFTPERYGRVLTEAMARGETIYSSAYIMPSGSRMAGSTRKHETHLDLLGKMMRDRLVSRLQESTAMANVFHLLRSYSMIGDFLAYQFTIDLNYGPWLNFSESEFVVPGPGARSGIRKCFTNAPDWKSEDLIKLMADHQEKEFERLGLHFQTLEGRRLHLIDCQNLFCEIDKYSRVKYPEITGLFSRTRIKRKFEPNPTAISCWFPPKWGLNGSSDAEGNGRGLGLGG
jgi:hypothetical protein